MTLRSLPRLVAGLTLALLVAMTWAKPSEAHTGHGEAAAATQADVEPTATPNPMAAGAADCGGHMNQNGADTTSCCSNTCHAAMSADMATLQAVAVAVTVLPTLAAPPELSGPTMHLRRPPRPSAALVG